MDEVFISYSRVDSSFVHTLDRGLREAEKDVWIDWEDIPPSADWMAEISAAVQGASAFVFVLTEASARSEVCARELELALADNKRIVPVVPGAMDPSKAPEELARLNWISFDPAGDAPAFEASMSKLVAAIDTDLEWVAAHTHWLTRARNWERRERDHSLLLRGNDLRQAEDFLASQREAVEPEPTELQREFVLESRRAAGRRQRLTLGAVGAGMIVAIVLAIFAFIQRNEANNQKRQAQSQALSARADAAATSNPILSAQLAREAVGTSSTPAAVSSLRAAVTRLGVHAAPGRPYRSHQRRRLQRRQRPDRDRRLRLHCADLGRGDGGPGQRDRARCRGQPRDVQPGRVEAGGRRASAGWLPCTTLRPVSWSASSTPATNWSSPPSSAPTARGS